MRTTRDKVSGRKFKLPSTGEIKFLVGVAGMSKHNKIIESAKRKRYTSQSAREYANQLKTMYPDKSVYIFTLNSIY